MSRPAPRRRLLVLAGALVLAGVGVARLATAAGSPAAVGPGPRPSASAADREPSAAAAMVCGPEIRGDVRTVLALDTTPAPTSTWRDGLFTCTYRLAPGRLVLSVHESADPATARSWYDGRRSTYTSTRDTPGLGEAAYRTGDGVVVVIKDSAVLTVDARGFPVQFGPERQKRTDLAYEIASDVLGCWTGHEPDGR